MAKPRQSSLPAIEEHLPLHRLHMDVALAEARLTSSPTELRRMARKGLLAARRRLRDAEHAHAFAYRLAVSKSIERHRRKLGLD